jgi:hypothetical protein
MSLVSTQQPFNTSLPTSTEADPQSDATTLGSLLGAFAHGQSPSSMDRGAPEYTQSGLHTPYPAFVDAQSEGNSADHASAAQYTPQPEVRSTTAYSTSATPTSEYGVYPASARSGSFPEHIQRQYHPASNHSGSSAGMAQATSPSMPLPDGRSSHQPPQIKSDQDVPIDPSIAANSPTHPPYGGGQYSPYPPQQDMTHGYPQHPGGQMYAQPRPDWAGYGGQPHHMPAPYPTTGVSTPTSAAPVRPGQVSFSTRFVPFLSCYASVDNGSKRISKKRRDLIFSCRAPTRASRLFPPHLHPPSVCLRFDAPRCLKHERSRMRRIGNENCPRFARVGMESGSKNSYCPSKEMLAKDTD